MNEKSKHSYHGNKNAAKAEADKASSYIHARCKPDDKAAWVKAAQSKGMKLTDWITKTLNAASEHNF